MLVIAILLHMMAYLKRRSLNSFKVKEREHGRKERRKEKTNFNTA
jgi:hypothetical protein